MRLYGALTGPNIGLPFVRRKKPAAKFAGASVGRPWFWPSGLEATVTRTRINSDARRYSFDASGSSTWRNVTGSMEGSRLMRDPKSSLMATSLRL